MWNGAQERTGFVADALGVGEVTGVLIGDLSARLIVGKRRERAESREETRDVADAMAEGLGLGREGGARENEVVFVEPTPAAGRRGDDGIDVLWKGTQVGAGEILRRAQIADMPCQRAAAALRGWHEHF